LLLTLGVASCGSDATPTQVLLSVDAESGVRTEARSLRIQVFSKDGRDGPIASSPVFDEAFAVAKWPRRITLVPVDNDANRWYAVLAVATTAVEGGGRVISEARLVSGYAAGQSLELSLVLTDACRDVTCERLTETCRNGVCVDAVEDP